MKAAVAWSAAQGSGGSLRGEALRVLVRFFAAAGEQDAAYAHFTELGEPVLVLAMLLRLAMTYTEQGKFSQAISSYCRLIAAEPEAPGCPGQWVRLGLG